MLRYTVNRLLLFIPLLFGLSVLVFLYIHMIPGDPVQAMVGPSAGQDLVAQIREQFGLNRPLYQQYVDWLGKALHGDLGITFRSRAAITPLLIARIPATLELAFGGLIIALLLAIPSGVIAGLNRNTRFDYVFTIISLGGYSMPLFWSGTLLLLLLGVHWHVLPTQGYVAFNQNPGQNLKLLIMPALTLGIGFAPYIARMTRTAVVETLQEPFIAYARAKGLRQMTLFARYVLRHAIVNIVVVLGLLMGSLLSGQIIVEELFAWPGAGRLMVRAVIERDYYMVEATVLIYAAVFLLINFGAELLHAWLDPRVQLK